MQTMIQGTRGLRLILNLNWDRLFALGLIFGALFAGAWVIDAVQVR